MNTITAFNRPVALGALADTPVDIGRTADPGQAVFVRPQFGGCA